MINSKCVEIEYGDVDGSPISHDISNVEIGVLITQICANEKVMSYFWHPVHTQ